eukprot:1216417-Prymnesium_polylepis.1
MGGRRRDRARSNGKESYLSACRVRRCARLAPTPAHRVIAHVVALAKRSRLSAKPGCGRAI